MNQKINVLAFSYAGGTISFISMLLFGVFGNMGIYMGAVDIMLQSHMFFSLSFGGIISGMIEAGIMGFIGFYVFGWLYNKFV